MSQFITTTPLLEMRPVGTPADRSLPRVEAILSREFEGRLSTRLAEPIERRDGSGIDWYVENERDDPIVRLADLPGELPTYYKKRLDTDVATISMAIEQYETRTDPAARSTASALRSAICYPDETNLWVMGDAQSGRASIVVTAWGYEPKTSPHAGSNIIHRREKIFPASAQVVIDQSPPSSTESTQAQPAGASRVDVERPRRWLRWFSTLLWMFAVTLPFIIGWYLLPACGVRMPFTQSYLYGWGGGEFCRQLANPQMEAGRIQEAALSADLITVQDQVKAKIGQCVVTSPVNNSAVSTDEQRITAEGLQVDQNETSISLTWQNTNDLDLYLVCPNGDRVPLGPDGARRCGFKHELDMNRGKLVDGPVEYIKHEGELEPGTYKVQVIYFSNNPPSPIQTDFTVSLRRNGIRREIHGTTSSTKPIQGNKETIDVTEFTVP